MSIKVQTMVWDRFPGEDHELLLALKLADFCDDNGEHIFPSIETLAEKTRRSVRAVQYQIKSMVERGWLILVANAAGGRGRACEYRINPDWINGAEIAPISSGSKGATDAPNGKGATGSKKGATDDGKGAMGFAKGCNGLHPIHHEPPQEPSENHQGARRAPKVAAHGELQSIELPDWLAFEDWDMWCEHREAKHKDAPWTRPAATVSIRKLTKLRSLGQDPKACIEEAVLRGWTGLFPLKGDVASTSSGTGATASPDWWKTALGIRDRAKQLGVEEKAGQVFEQFKARVFKAAGPGEWMEDMLRTVSRESEERYEALYAFFNDIPREQAAQQVAA
ncbi:helix-turn-helix domain-containing protein [Burkholderia vietnamiensis]|uniref:helix-turn-helix domain-containing protein n=1 Tax=Burkholderia vietnamiensis TaxID=60552 RepID=UPI001B977CB4|nr:helix-turn-helix domain-containing protein [Burkholderia vietnamiensis]MBR8030817.1 helix-turn-helix domain-containing protein [Burkholderia vietnamiensis]